MFNGFINLARLRGFDIIEREVNGRLVEGCFIPFKYNDINVIGDGAFLHFNAAPCKSETRWNYMLSLCVMDKKVASENREYGFEKDQMRLGRMRNVTGGYKFKRAKMAGEKNLDKLFE